VGVFRDCPNFLGKATEFKFCRNIHVGSIETKAHENVGNSGRGRSKGVPKIFRAPICRAHCAVILAIAQLSCSIRRTPFGKSGVPAQTTVSVFFCEEDSGRGERTVY